MADLKASFDELPSSETIITEQKLTEELKATKKTLADLKESFDKYPPSDEIITEQIYKAKLLELSDSVNNIRKAFNDDLDSKLNPIDDKLKKQRTDIDKLREEFDALPEDIVTDGALTDRLRGVHRDIASNKDKLDQLPQKDTIITTTILTQKLKDHETGLKEIFQDTLSDIFKPIQADVKGNSNKIDDVAGRLSKVETALKGNTDYTGFGAD